MKRWRHCAVVCTSAAVSERGGRRTFRPARGLGGDSWSGWMEEEVGSSSMLARRGEEQGWVGRRWRELLEVVLVGLAAEEAGRS